MGNKRRLIGYLLLAATLIVSVIVMVNPVFTKMTPGREFTNGNEFVYQLRQKDVGEDESSVVTDKGAADEVAKIMVERLENYQIEDYSVVVSGDDMIRVSLSTNDETELNYIRKYLAFSGGDFSLAGKNEETRISHNDVFKDITAYIIHEQDLVPYVIIPVSNPDKIKTLIETVNPTSGEPEQANRRNKVRFEGDEEESKDPDIFLWANWEEGDTYEKATADASVTGQKIIAQFVSDNIWYTKSSTENTELQFLCGFADSEGNYDATKLKQANQQAKYLCNLINATAFDYDVVDLFVTESASGVTYNQIRSDATIENLLNLGSDVNVNIMAGTMIGSIVALLIIALVLFYFYHLTAIGMFANTLATIFLSYLLFITMNATFNVAAFFGGILIATGSLIAELYYANKFKEEVYKGRNFKKANQEATKKASLVSLDVTVVMMILGIFLYFLGGNALRPMGILAFFGGLISLLMNLLVFRLLNYLLTNSTNLIDNYKAFNIDESLVPHGDEEKEVFEGPYANKDFSMKKKPTFIALVSLLVCALAGAITFTAIDGNALNVTAANQDNSELIISLKDDNPEISNYDEFVSTVIPNVLVNDKAIAYKDVEVENREEYDYLTTITTKYTYFIVSFDGKAPNENLKYKVGELIHNVDTLEEAFEGVILSKTTLNADDIDLSLKVAHETVQTPHQGFIMLATLIGVIVATIYLSLRYRPSRGLAVGGLTLAVTTITFGWLALVRIPTNAITTLLIPMVALYALLTSIFFLTKAKDLYLDEKDLSLDNRKVLTNKAVATSAAITYITAIISTLGLVMLFGFGNISCSIAILGVILGIIVFSIFFLLLVGPCVNLLEKYLAKIKLPEGKKKDKKKRREKIKLQKKNSSEPQETIFIGIND